jgi:hypothetical protein
MPRRQRKIVPGVTDQPHRRQALRGHRPREQR